MCDVIIDMVLVKRVQPPSSFEQCKKKRVNWIEAALTQLNVLQPQFLLEIGWRYLKTLVENAVEPTKTVSWSEWTSVSTDDKKNVQSQSFD